VPPAYMAPAEFEWEGERGLSTASGAPAVQPAPDEPLRDPEHAKSRVATLPGR